jgi:hypothetical protein
MGRYLDDLSGHEGWAGRRLVDGTLTSQFLSEGEFLGHRPCCSCGWIGAEEFPPTEEGEEEALAMWEAEHAGPLAALTVPAALEELRRELTSELLELAEERPLAALAQFRRLREWCDLQGDRAARRAREQGAGWAEVGRAVGVSAQGAQQRWGKAG